MIDHQSFAGESTVTVDPISPDGTHLRKPPRGPSRTFWLVHLYFQPKRFFEHFSVMATRFTTIYTAWIVGTAECMSRVTEEITKRQFLGGHVRVPELVLTSWPAYWAFCAGVGVFGAALFYKIGGWWYITRLRFCNDSNADRSLARSAYIFSSTVWAFPIVLSSAISSIRYSTPLASENSSMLWAFVLLVPTPFWSIYTSYRAVRTLFDGVRWKVRLWFLLLPGLVYGAVFVAIFVVALLAAAGSIDVPPDVDNPITIDRVGLYVRHPGNWWVDEDAEGFDADASFTIEPIQDAAAIFDLWDEPVDERAETTEWVEYYRETFHGDDISEFHQWGGHTGFGMDYWGVSEVSRYRLRVFTFNGATRAATVVEICEESVTEVLEPGFKLIRNSFRLKD